MNFRLSEDEYETLKEAARDQGSRSISDFARAAILNSVQARSSVDGQPVDLAKLDRKVSEIQGAVAKLTDIVAHEARPERAMIANHGE